MKQFRNSHYYVEIDGTVISKKRKKDIVLKTYFTSNGYSYYSLYLKPFVKSNIYTHRLVAETYLSSYTNSLQVNHIDGDKTNNHMSNLEMVDCKQNVSKYLNVYKEYYVTKNWSAESKLCRTYHEVMLFCGYSSRSSVEYLMNNPVTKKYTTKVICKYYSNDTIDKK